MSVCQKYRPEFPQSTLSGQEQTAWISNVYTNLFAEDCLLECVGTQATIGPNSTIQPAVPGVCAGTSVDEECLNCVLQLNCATDVTDCMHCLNEQNTSFAHTQCCVDGICSSNNGLSDSDQIALGVGIGATIILIITLVIIFRRRKRK